MSSHADGGLLPIEDDVTPLTGSRWISAAALILGLIGLPLAAHLTVGGAAAVASTWGVSDAVIGLTIVAIGTSLPELATTVIAAIRQHGALALGNVLGSNLFNMLAIIGITAMVTPLEIPAEMLRLDIWVMLAATLLLLPFVVWEVPIGRIAGIAFLAAYVVYIGFLLSPAPKRGWRNRSVAPSHGPEPEFDRSSICDDRSYSAHRSRHRRSQAHRPVHRAPSCRGGLRNWPAL